MLYHHQLGRRFSVIGLNLVYTHDKTSRKVSIIEKFARIKARPITMRQLHSPEKKL